MILKTHKSLKDYVVAACDKRLLGKKIIDEEKDIEITINKNFYGGRKCTQEELVEEMKKATIVNLIGEKTVSTAIKYEFINKDSVIRINNVPHAQIIRML